MSMVEKVAKAIYEAMDVADGLDLPAATVYARAAIEAMMDADEQMIEAGVTADHGRTLGERVTNSHRAMLLAALHPRDSPE